MIYLTILSVTKVIYRRMVGCLVSNKLERTRKEAVMALFEGLPDRLLTWTENNYE
jgi:hypothetical protein